MKRGDIIILVILLVLGLAGAYAYFFTAGDPQGLILVQVEKTVVATYPLFQKDRDEYIDIQGINGITRIHLQDGRVRVEESACPDKVCVNTGWIHNSAQAIACLPNRVFVKIVNSEPGDFDLR